jgi:DNA-directed RNA polymerase subunit M/transcription elongation factor TFIIS
MVQRRSVKLPYRELYISCPHCQAPLRIGTFSEKPLMSQRKCPKCGKEFQIENDVVKKTSAKKPSESVHAAKTVKRTKSR